MRNADTVALIKHNLQKADDSIIQAGALPAPDAGLPNSA